jgi:hypothetical protein
VGRVNMRMRRRDMMRRLWESRGLASALRLWEVGRVAGKMAID